MRLIDADKLLKFFTVDTANQTYRFGTVKKQIESAPTIKAIPLDKVKEARKEFISKYPKNYMGEPELGGRTCYFSLNEVFSILDKLIAESEDK